MRKTYLLYLALLTTTFFAYGQTNIWTNGNGTGIWSDDLNWSLGIAPDGSGPVEFNSATGTNADCLIDAAVIGGQAVSTTLTIISNYTGNITFDAGIGFQGSAFSIAAGNFDATNAGDISFTTYSQSGGTFTSTTGNLFLSGSMSKTGGTFTHNSGTVYISTTTATITVANGLVFGNLTLGRGAVNGTSVIQIGTLTSHSITVTGNLTVTNSVAATSIRINNGTINLQGDYDNSGNNGNVTTAQSATILLNGTGNQSIFGLAAGNTAAYTPSISINKSSGSLTLTDFITINGNLTVTAFSGTPTVSGSTITMIGASRSVDGKGASTLAFNNFSIGRSAASAGVTLTDDLKVNGNLTINNSSSTFTTGGFALGLEGGFTNSATFTPGTSTITLSGGNAQSLDFRNTTDVTINTLVVNKSAGTATISDNINISDVLTSTAGTLDASGKVTLLSTSSKTAEVGSVGGTLSGNFIIQRYIPTTSSSKWRFLAAPITSGSSLTIRNGWQSQIFITGNGTGTGPVGTANYNNNGFDWTSSGNPSMYIYNENQNLNFNSRWTAIGSPTSTNLVSGMGYRVFVRGDRSDAGRLNGTVSTQNAVTLSVTGVIPTGNQVLSTTCSNGCGTDDGWNMVGNPFPATVNWDNVSRSSVDATVYIFSPSLNAYTTYTAGGSGTNGGEKYVHSGQALFVKCNSSSGGSVTFKESDKLVGGASGFFKTGEVTNELRIFMTNPAATVKDEIIVGFNDGATKNYDGDYDAYKIGATAFGALSSYTTTSKTLLAVNKITPQQGFTVDTIPLNLSLGTAINNYSLNFSGVSTFTSGISVYLFDKYLNTLVDLSGAPIYDFATGADSASFVKRFYIYVGNNPPLSVKYKFFDAVKNQNDVLVSWSTLSEENNTGFEVQRSNDARNFTAIGTVNGGGNSTTELNYTYTDLNPDTGLNYYRIKQTNTSGQIQYSSVAVVDFTPTTTGVGNIASGRMSFKVYPVPAKNELTLSLNQEVKGTIKLTIYDPFGHLISSKIIPAPSTNEIKEDVSSLRSGVFFMELKTSNGVTQKVKFIKD